MWLIKIVAILCGVYVLVVAAMFFAQTWLIFPSFMISDGRPHLPDSGQRLEIETPDGEHLHGVHLPPLRAGGGEKTVVLGFAGNGWHAEGMVLDLRRHFPECDVVAFNYRGYRPSSGRPSAAGMLADSLLIHDHIQATIGPMRTITAGYSLGTGVAAYVARQRPVAGIILVTPFDSLEAVAQERYPWVPVRWLIRHRMSTVDFLRGLPIPTAMIAAERDVVVPPSRTAALRKAIGNLVLDRTIAGTQHNTIFRYPEFAQAMRDAMAAIDANPASRASGDPHSSAR